MIMFERNKSNLKPKWVFNQNGNLWKFMFGGKDYIVGETRDLEKKILYLFSIRIEDCKNNFINYMFEDGNYWISLEGATSNIVFLNRFEKPELPYHKNIIALDILSGKKLWENEEYQYFFSTEEKLFGIKQKFQNTEISEINILNGKTYKIFSEEEYPALLELKRKSDNDLYNEFNDYPRSFKQFPPEIKLHDIITSEVISCEGEIEYLEKNNYLLFNYYEETKLNIKDITKKSYKNIFCVYNTTSGKKVYTDILNRHSGYNVPDNFLSRNEFVFYLREKKDIVALKI